MRTIKRASQFKKDYKRELKGLHGKDLEESLKPVLTALVNDQPLDAAYLDHPLSGNWKNYRECHVKNDLLLIYSTETDDELQLARLGSHSELF